MFRGFSRRLPAGWIAVAFIVSPRDIVAAQQPAVSARAADSARRAALDTVKVLGRAGDLRGLATSASEGHVGAADLRLRPLLREGELLEAVPGMIVTQHSGDGKANQYFVRGFNLDHGTDFATRLEGMPLNFPSHAHGQGYTDLNFLIPEFVERIDYKLGVYHPEIGDFGSAGGAEFRLTSKLDHSFANVQVGQDGFARLATGMSQRVAGGNLLVGGESKVYDGPWEVPEKIRKLSGLARYTWGSPLSEFSVLGLAYGNRWNASDQIPLRAVREGLVSRFGELDSTDGGRASRYSLSGSYRHAGARSTQTVQLFAVRSDLALFSNFTYFLDDPLRGDQFSQVDRRMIFGGNVTNARVVEGLGGSHTITVGLQERTDLIDTVGLYRTTNRVRYATVRSDAVDETTAGLFIEVESRWGGSLHTLVGVRGDAFHFGVASDNPENSGHRTAEVISPKASIAFAPSASLEVYASGGFGFHSNDARGTTITVDPTNGSRVNRVDPLVRSRGVELGLRTSTIPGVQTTLSAWTLRLDSELLFTGDAGVTEPAEASRRSGVTLTNAIHPIPQITMDADVSLARARFEGLPRTMARIPGALENVVAGGVTYEPRTRGFFSSLRLRHFGAYPLAEDNSLRARASTLVNANVGFAFASGTRVTVGALNLFDATPEDIQYAYASRLRGERSDGIDDVHFHPAEPRQIRLTVERRF